MQIVIDHLILLGMRPERFQYPDTIKTMHALLEAGATLEIFNDAYEIAKTTSINGFGVNYIAKVVEGLLKKNRKEPKQNIKKINQPITMEDEDLTKGAHWIGDLID